MQASAHMVVSLAALSLYKAAAASLRSCVETALYYTYFRTHPAELVTLIRDPKYFISKAEVIDYHKLHTIDFGVLQREIDLVGRLDRWYSFVSAIVHGQVPGKWLHQKSFADIKHNKDLEKVVVATFIEGSKIIHDLFLCVLGKELWDTFTPSGKRQLLAGVDGKFKAVLALDAS
jgi:hypothetical protein